MLLMRRGKHISYIHRYLYMIFISLNYSSIMNYFYLADKDRSGTLTKQECYRLLKDTLNAKVSNHVFERFFKV